MSSKMTSILGGVKGPIQIGEGVELPHFLGHLILEEKGSAQGREMLELMRCERIPAGTCPVNNPSETISG